MIEKLNTGMYRVRFAYGHEKRYKRLKKKSKPTELEKIEMQALEDEWGLPKRVGTRRSMNCHHKWEAEHIEKCFMEANELEAIGRKPPASLLEFKTAPKRESYIEELGHLMASICGFSQTLISNLEYDIFLSQADANTWWLKELQVEREEIEAEALQHCDDFETFNLKNKSVVFTGAVCGFTGHSDYLKSLARMCRQLKIDTIITTGPWIKTIFLHKVASKPTILKELKDLAQEFQIIAVRSNRDMIGKLHQLKNIGVRFVDKIEDDKNIFVGETFSRNSAKNQMKKFEESYLGKNVFFHTTFVGLKSQGQYDGVRFLVGSGSANINTPRSRVWANSYDSQLMDSKNRDSIGGHIVRFDSKANPYITTFRYHEELKGILFGGMKYGPSSVKEGKLAIILSDFHAATHHKKAFAALLDFLERHKSKIGLFAINGDFFANMILCHHNRGKFKKQIEMAKRDLDYIKEIAYTKECLKMITKILSPSCVKKFKLGNHEVNSINTFLNRDINHFLETLLDIKVLLGLNEFGYDLIGNKEAYRIADVYFWHGHEMQRGKARKTLGKNNAKGHTHGVDIDADGMTVGGMEDPEKVDFVSHKYLDWTCGFSSMTIVDDMSVLPQPLIYTKGGYCDFEKIRKMTKEAKVNLPDQLTVTYKIDWTGREGL